MTEEKIREVMEKFALEAKKIYGTALHNVILYGSCVRGDFGPDIDIAAIVKGERRKLQEYSMF